MALGLGVFIFIFNLFYCCKLLLVLLRRPELLCGAQQQRSSELPLLPEALRGGPESGAALRREGVFEIKPFPRCHWVRRAAT